MTDFGEIRVHEILGRPYFRNAEVIAGRKALERVVKWVHIMEVTKVGRLLNGNELILSTGIGWQEEEDIGLAFLRELIDCGAAGLCIELGTYTKKSPERMKELAVRSDFPLILFHEEVRYVDITRDLHTFFVNRHHRMMSDLDVLTNRFNRLLLSGKGLTPLLRLLHEKTRRQVALLPADGEPITVPPRPGYVRTPDELRRGNAAVRPIAVMGRKVADLILESNEALGEFDALALDRCATAVAQETMRTLHMEEHRKLKENVWVLDWLNGKLKAHEIAAHVDAVKPGASPRSALACAFELDRKTLAAPDFETSLIQRIVTARSAFEQHGCLVVPAQVGQLLVFVLLPYKNQVSDAAVLQAVEKLRKSDKPGGLAMFGGLAGVGPAVTPLTELPRSFEAACRTVALQKSVGPLRRPLYTELHVYRIVSNLEKTGDLPALIEDYLGPILRYEPHKNAQLLKTLKVYLQLSGAKQETANALFIVRQTLYHRLNKLGELLGEDFMAPEKRLMLELALYAYEYVHGPVA